MSKVVQFSDLESSDLFVDCLYKGGTVGNLSDDVLHRLLPSCGNAGGFRLVRTKSKKKVAFVVLFTTMSEIEWPDYLDAETGVFRYYGDNRNPGRDLYDTKKKGNSLLKKVFECLNLGKISEIPPFLIFRSDQSRDIRFLGLAAPGVSNFSPDRELVAFWRTISGQRFQNYEAYFTVLDTGDRPISREWLVQRFEENPDADKLAPSVWRYFQKNGREGLRALKAKVIKTYPSWYEQIQSNATGTTILESIRRLCSDKAYDFEMCATDVLLKADNNFTDFVLTRPWRDGGRDAIGYYQIHIPGESESSLRIDCALEAKCYSPTKNGGNGVGVREMSRLISRIRYRQFGAMVTTSFISKQAYDEVKADGHPILMVTATNIATVLQQHGIHSEEDVTAWMREVKSKYTRLL